MLTSGVFGLLRRTLATGADGATSSSWPAIRASSDELFVPQRIGR
jgi:hypothetical protein